MMQGQVMILMDAQFNIMRNVFFPWLEYSLATFFKLNRQRKCSALQAILDLLLQIKKYDRLRLRSIDTLNDSQYLFDWPALPVQE